MNTLSTTDRVAVLSALVEGNSIRATSRMTGDARNTVTKLLEDMGEACIRFADSHMRGIACKDIQVDEIWAFCYAKAKNVPEEMRGTFGVGDVWTWTAIDADTKLVVSWLVGNRDGATAVHFMSDVASRVTGRPQITSDGFNAYRWAVFSAFDGEVDHAIVQKLFCRSHMSLGKKTPAMAAGLADHKWTMAELVQLMDSN